MIVDAMEKVLFSSSEILLFHGLSLEEVVLTLIQQVLDVIEGFFEPPEPCLQLRPMGLFSTA
jgi:hypothetical protein